MNRGSELDSARGQALDDLRRLSSIILDNLQEGSRNKLMDQKELRLMGSTALRSIRLFLKTIEDERSRHAQDVSIASKKPSAAVERED